MNNKIFVKNWLDIIEDERFSLSAELGVDGIEGYLIEFSSGNLEIRIQKDFLEDAIKLLNSIGGNFKYSSN